MESYLQGELERLGLLLLAPPVVARGLLQLLARLVVAGHAQGLGRWQAVRPTQGLDVRVHPLLRLGVLEGRVRLLRQQEEPQRALHVASLLAVADRLWISFGLRGKGLMNLTVFVWPTVQKSRPHTIRVAVAEPVACTSSKARSGRG